MTPISPAAGPTLYRARVVTSCPGLPRDSLHNSIPVHFYPILTLTIPRAHDHFNSSESESAPAALSHNDVVLQALNCDMGKHEGTYIVRIMKYANGAEAALQLGVCKKGSEKYC